jgi:anti-anti-sigma regulatory factor
MPDYRPLIIRLNDSEWDLATREKLQFLLGAATDRVRVFIDMSAVAYMDATCLGKLARMQRERLCKVGLTPATLVVAHPSLWALFKLVGFGTAWPMFATLDEALADDSPEDDLTHRAAI